MTASTKPKTPSMILPVRKGAPRPIVDAFCRKATRLSLAQVVDGVTVKERLAANGQSRNKEYTINLTFFPAAEYCKEHDVEPSDILAVFAVTFPSFFKKEVLTEMKKVGDDLKNQMAEVGKGTTVKSRDNAPANDGGENEDGEDEGRSRRKADEASELGDGDAEDEKRARQTKEQASYESDDEVEGGADEDVDDLNRAIEQAYGDGQDVDMDEEEIKQRQRKVKGNSLRAQVEGVEATFKEIFNPLKTFSFREDGCTIEIEVRNDTLIFFLNSLSKLKPSLVFIKLPKTIARWRCRTRMRQDCYSRNFWHNRLLCRTGGTRRFAQGMCPY
jgi:hypothetical protein